MDKDKKPKKSKSSESSKPSKTKTNFTEEQRKYINFDKLIDTKLLACAGSGKTRCIIFKLDRLIRKKIVSPNEILMLTFSKFTRDDFIGRIEKYNVKSINSTSIRTIDEYAKKIIDADDNSDTDVSLLSYKFMHYLEQTDVEELKKNINLSQIKCIFVDEAQDLNQTQYNILILMKNKLGASINLVGDPNQNIYQFRNSSDKYLNEFEAKTFYLTINFRSFDSIIEFSKYLRPNNETKITGALGKSKHKPNIIFHENDSELEAHIMDFLTRAKKNKINFKDIAILSPTRGRMKGYGESHGLCLISNLLYKNKIKFKQFYEEATDEIDTGIKYCPEDGKLNVLTYMGSKGLEWKYVLLVDAHVCLINKRSFSIEKHNNDRYLLYVACSRAINNMIIYSRYKFSEGNLSFYLNPWFEHIPSHLYDMDKRLEKYFKYPNVKPKDMNIGEKRITKIIDNFDDVTLDRLSTIINKKTTAKTSIYDDYSKTITSNVFMGKYVEKLFFAYYRITHGLPRQKYIDVENIVDSKHVVMDINVYVSEWYYRNRDCLTWQNFDIDKKIPGKLDKTIIECVENRFSREIELSDHTLINDGYYKSFILSVKDTIGKYYDLYMNSNDSALIRESIFYITVLMHSLETQHYYHTTSGGKKFKYMLKEYSNLFYAIELYAGTTEINITDTNVMMSKWGIVGEIDFMSVTPETQNRKTIWEIKCVSELTLKNILQVVIYNIMYYELDVNQGVHIVNEGKKMILNFINLLKGEIVNIDLELTLEEINEIKNLFVKQIDPLAN